MTEIHYIVGVDEAGRGPLAGPVAVAAVLMERAVYEAYLARPEATSRIKKIDSELRLPVGKDSKKLTPRLREIWHDWLVAEKRAGRLNYLVGLSSPANIDRFGIVVAIRLALDNCLLKLTVSPAETLILLDGGLKAPKEYPHQKTIIKGDENEPIIALASVAAKVERDHKLKKLALDYPGYGLEKHKGYGTKAHYEALKHLGPSPIHRRSFL